MARRRGPAERLDAKQLRATMREVQRHFQRQDRLLREITSRFVRWPEYMVRIEEVVPGRLVAMPTDELLALAAAGALFSEQLQEIRGGLVSRWSPPKRAKRRRGR